jgi:hypothetical protein
MENSMSMSLSIKELPSDNIKTCIDRAEAEACEILADTAENELRAFHQHFKAMKDQMDRSERAVAALETKDRCQVEILCDIRDSLKPFFKSKDHCSSDIERKVVEILEKHFSMKA